VRAWYYRKLRAFFDKPRNRALCLLGAMIIEGSLKSCRANVDAYKKAIETELTHLGRLELVMVMIKKRWEE